MKTAIVVFFFCVFQLTFSQELDAVIDSSFSFIGMSKNDLRMPCDAVDKDSFRFSTICEFFENPLSTLQFTNSFLSNQQFSPFSQEFYQLLTKTLELPSSQKSKSEYTLNSKDITNFKKVLGSYPEYPQLIQYLQNIVSLGISSKNSSEYLYRNVDDLLRNNEANEQSTVYSFKLNEISSYNQSLKLFDSIHANRQIISKVVLTGHLLSHELLQLQNFLLKNPIKIQKQFVFTVDKHYRIVIGSSKNDTYTSAEFLIIDCLGDDSYMFNESKETLSKVPNRLIIDLQGDDIYKGKDYSFGAGYFGSGILFDVVGNDHYIAGSLSLGTGVFGFGVLYDQGGNDTYSSAVTSQGSGAFGFGILWDKGGNDIYTVQSQGQGFGYTLGIGVLREEGGNDYYLTSSPFLDVLRYDNHFVTFTQGASLGFRPIASGGIGILSDTEGNDKYSSDIYGQGTAYWFGLGALVDSKGEDVYTSYQYAQGSGVHLAFGILLDSAGNDVYTSHGVSQGCGHDIAMGALVDFSGDDHYFAESLSLGSGNANASSLFYDLHGNDSYVGLNETNTFGYSDFRRNYGMMGIFCDAFGKDVYNSILNNNSVTHKSTYGTFLDFNFNTNTNVISPKNDQGTVSKSYPHSDNLDSLFMEASTPLNSFQYIVTPARKKFSTLPQEDVIPLLVSKFSSVFPRDRLALEMILPEVYDKSKLWKKVILDSLSTSVNLRVLSICSYVVTKKKIREALPFYRTLLESQNWKVASLIAERIGEIGDSTCISWLQNQSISNHPYVRSKVALSLGILSKGSLQETSSLFIQDNEQVVRNNFVAGLLQTDSIPLVTLQQLFEKSLTSYSKISTLRLLQKIEHTPLVTSFLLQLYASLSIPERSILLNELVNKRNKSYFASVLQTIKVKETNEILFKFFQ